jgi:uncharacterized protein (TIGR02588 family)
VSDDAEQARPRRATGRRLAEWVTLGVSAVLVAGVAGFLLYGALQEQPPFVPVDVRVLTELAREDGGRYIVPVELRNRGRRTVKDLQVRVRYESAGGGKESGDFTVDYLGDRATQKVYLYFDRHPRDLRVDATPFAYQLE